VRISGELMTGVDDRVKKASVGMAAVPDAVKWAKRVG